MLEGSIKAEVQVTGDNFLQSTYNAIIEVAEFGVKDLSIPNVQYDGGGTTGRGLRRGGFRTDHLRRPSSDRRAAAAFGLVGAPRLGRAASSGTARNVNRLPSA